MYNRFDIQNRKGKQGEREIKEYYKNKGVNVVDVSNKKEFQQQDIDFFFNGQSVEVKTANYLNTHNNIILEIVSNDNENDYKMGWLYTCTADVMIFYNPKTKIMYQFFTNDLLEYYNKNKDIIYHEKYYSKEFEKAEYIKCSLLAYIPVDELLTNIKKYRIETIA